MRRFLSGLLPLCFLTACGTTSSVKTQVELPASTSFQFADNRPPAQLITRLPTAADDEFYFGDDSITPTAPELLREALHRQASASLKGKSVRLDDLVVSVKDAGVSVDQNKLQSSAATVPGGNPISAGLAGLMIYGIESVRSKKWVYVRIRGTVDDKPFSAFQNDGYTGRVTEANVLRTLRAVVDLAVVDAERAARSD